MMTHLGTGGARRMGRRSVSGGGRQRCRRRGDEEEEEEGLEGKGRSPRWGAARGREGRYVYNASLDGVLELYIGNLLEPFKASTKQKQKQSKQKRVCECVELLYSTLSAFIYPILLLLHALLSLLHLRPALLNQR